MRRFLLISLLLTHPLAAFAQDVPPPPALPGAPPQPAPTGNSSPALPALPSDAPTAPALPSPSGATNPPTSAQGQQDQLFNELFQDKNKPVTVPTPPIAVTPEVKPAPAPEPAKAPKKKRRVVKKKVEEVKSGPVVPMSSPYDSYLFNAAANNDRRAMQALLDGGLNIETRNDRGETPLIHAARFRRDYAVKYLLERGADANAADPSGFTPMHYAAYAGDINTATALFNSKANIRPHASGGITPLMLAAQNNGSHAVLDLLLRVGAPANETTEQGLNALHMAAKAGNESAVLRLLQAGANPDAKDSFGFTPRNYATLRASGQTMPPSASATKAAPSGQ